MLHQAPPPFEFDPLRLDDRLRKELPELRGKMRLERVTGGQSNPTFFVSYDNRRMVLRKKPPGALLPSAHAVDREYRILSDGGDGGSASKSSVRQARRLKRPKDARPNMPLSRKRRLGSPNMRVKPACSDLP
jgi:hypothetical protein